MKSILLFLLASFPALAEVIPVVPLISGRPLEAVSIVGAEAKGIKLKTKRGTQLYKWTDITPEGLRALGAVDREKGINAHLDPANRDVAMFSESFLTPLVPGSKETPEEFRKRMEEFREHLIKVQPVHGGRAEKAKTPEARDRAISYALGIALRLHEVDAILAAD